MPLSLTAKISVLPAPHGGEILIKKLFEPLGYTVEAERHPLDTQFPEWGYGKYFTLTLKNKLPLKQLLSHLYVLIPVLDNEKHYFITQDEVDKLLRKGKGWIEEHPEKETIVSRYLINLKSLMRSAFEILQTEENTGDKRKERAAPRHTLTARRRKIAHERSGKRYRFGMRRRQTVEAAFKRKAIYTYRRYRCFVFGIDKMQRKTALGRTVCKSARAAFIVPKFAYLSGQTFRRIRCRNPR